MPIDKNILISGSLVYDRIMDFHGFFKDHILPDKIHILNVSFVVDDIKESFGGTAGNIAYNLALLDEKPKILGLVGDDFPKYADWLKKNKVDISQVATIKGKKTACAYIMTDQANSQITGFYGGPVQKEYCAIVKKQKSIGLAIIAPENKERMLTYAKMYKKLKIPYIFDPGQQITAFSADDFKTAIVGSKMVIGNDYEIQLIMDRMKINLEKLKKMTATIIITKGEEGSEIYSQNKKIIIPPAKPKNTCDPTGAGDAYRAGVIKGILEGWSWEKTGRLAGLLAVYTVEKYGTQTHKFNKKALTRRYQENFHELLF